MTENKSIWTRSIGQSSQPVNRPEFVCTNCGYKGYPKTMVKGNIGVEILLWLFFLLPGLIYSVWRSISRYKACPKCKAPNMIPVDSPIGQKLAAKETAS